MTYKGLNILHSSFFTLSDDGRLQLNRGKCKGKSPDEIVTISDISIVTGFCLWIMKQKGNDIIDYYLAACYINEVTPKVKNIEKGLRNTIEEQIKETEQSANTTGYVYGRRSS